MKNKKIKKLERRINTLEFKIKILSEQVGVKFQYGTALIRADINSNKKKFLGLF